MQSVLEWFLRMFGFCLRLLHAWIGQAASRIEDMGRSAALSKGLEDSVSSDLPEADQRSRQAPPEHWVQKTVSSPPSHWVERVRPVAPWLLQSKDQLPQPITLPQPKVSKTRVVSSTSGRSPIAITGSGDLSPLVPLIAAAQLIQLKDFDQPRQSTPRSGSTKPPPPPLRLTSSSRNQNNYKDKSDVGVPWIGMDTIALPHAKRVIEGAQPSPHDFEVDAKQWPKLPKYSESESGFPPRSGLPEHPAPTETAELSPESLMPGGSANHWPELPKLALANESEDWLLLLGEKMRLERLEREQRGEPWNG
jgi:hypothetical protein